MPRDSSGNYTLPAGNPVVAGTAITPTWGNNTLNDVKTVLTASLDRSGNGGMLAGLPAFAGTKALPGYAFSGALSSGWYLAGTNDVRFSLADTDELKFTVGTTTFSTIVNVGVDDTGYDVKFFGATSGKSMLWDESADTLIVTGTTTLIGTVNLDAVDIDGNVQLDGTLTVGVDDTGYDVKLFGATSGAYLLWDESADDLKLVGAAGLTVAGDIDVDGTTNLDAVDIDGAVQADATITVGVDDTGYDVKFFGATSGAYMLWDESADDLKLVGAAGLTVAGDIDVDGTTNLDAVDIDGAVQADGTITVGVDDTGYDVKFFGATSGAYMLWDESADDLKLVGAAGLTVAGDLDVDGTTNLDAVDIDGAVQLDATLSVGVDDTGYDVKFFGAAASAYMLWDASTDDLILGGAAQMGIGETAPANLLHVKASDTGIAPHASAQIVLEREGTNYLQFLTAENGTSGILFGDGSDIDVASIKLDHNTTDMTFATETSVAMTIEGEGNVIFGGIVTATTQPAFNVYPASIQSNIAINTVVDIVFGTEAFDQGSNFASNTFTAPVTGKYQLNVSFDVDNVDIDAGFYQIKITTSNKTYNKTYAPKLSADPAYWWWAISVLADMDASDTALIQIYQSGGAAQTDVAVASNFSGFLAC
tara:strand:- start:6645 stop:8588 length:1944 start_codon:yes stop_codon:yes gene_type:complete